jgi:hypothetical protein
MSGCHVEVFIGKTQEAVKELKMKLGLDLTNPTEKYKL